MKKWLPYLIAIVVGLGVAALMFLTGPDATPSAASTPSVATPSKGRETRGTTEDPMADLAPSDPSRASPEPPPPPGTLRPMNEAEIKQQAREARPFNSHTNRVQTFWQLASRELTGVDPALATEAREMMVYVRDQSRLNDGEVDIAAVIQAELDLEKRIRATGQNSARLTMILDYINSSANAVIQNGDPAAIPKPDLPD